MYLYRYERGSIENMGKIHHSAKVFLVEIQVIGETEKSYLLNEYAGHKKHISKTAKKRYAYPTKEEAMDNFIRRTQRCIFLLKTRLSRSENYLYAAKEMGL